MKKKAISITLGVLSLFAAISFWEGYRVAPPLDLSEAVNDDDLTLKTKVYSPEDSKEYLSKDLNSRGYQPIQITISNNTSHSYTVLPDQINLPKASPLDIAYKISKSSLPRSIGYRVAGLIFWPFAIPGTIDGIRTYHNQRKFKKQLIAKAIKDETVLPYSVVHRMLYVPMNKVEKILTVTLLDCQQQKLKTYELVLS